MVTPKITAKDLFTGLKTSLDQEPANLTMKKKLVITIAPTGSFTTREQNPYQPYNQKEIAEQTIESYKAGASVWHVHCRDDNGIPSKDPKVIKETIDMVLDKCPDMITSLNVIADYTKPGVGLISPIVEPMSKAGLKYIRTAVVTTHPVSIRNVNLPVTQTTLTEVVQYLQEKGIRPELQLHSYGPIHDVDEWLIRTGVLKKPYIMNLVLGFHAFHMASPTAPDPWGHIYLMSLMQTLPRLSPGDFVVGATIGGHNWLPMTVEAIMLGVDCVRVGMEDTVWMYPHKEDKIRRCVDVVNKITTIARELGREVATPAEAEKIMGLQGQV